MRAWAGQAPRVGGPAGAEDEVGPAGQHRRRPPAEVGRVERAVAVHEADDAVVRVGGQQAGPAGGAEAAAGLVDHDGAPPARAMSAEPSVEPLSTTMAVKPGGHGRQQAGQGAGLVEDGDHDVGHGGSLV